MCCLSVVLTCRSFQNLNGQTCNNDHIMYIQYIEGLSLSEFHWSSTYYLLCWISNLPTTATDRYMLLKCMTYLVLVNDVIPSTAELVVT